MELDKADPIVEDLLASLAHKQPKVVAGALSAITAIYHAFGVKVFEPKSVLKALPKSYGHADKNVRAEATSLTVELYRWLREAMKTLFWGELKPVQQQELEKLFEGVKQEPTPKQERLLRSQQAAAASRKVQEDAQGEYEEAEEEPEEVEVFDLEEPIDVFSKIPKDLHENLASSKWKDRKDALDALYAVAKVDRIKDGPYDEIVTDLAKCMKDANVAVVTVAATCVDVLARGLRKSFAKYRSRIMPPIMERLKEKKQAVADALGSALDAVFASTGLTDCLEDILEFLKHKNPQVKLETLRFLIRCLRNTREVPSKPETKAIADAATKLLTESTEVTRSGGAEILGTLMKIMGERAMNPYLDGLDDIRKTKIKEYFDTAEVKAKDKPKPVAPPPKAAPPAQSRTMGKKSAPGTGSRKPAPTTKAPPPVPHDESAPAAQARPTTGRGIPLNQGQAPKSGLAAPSGGLKLRGPGGAAPPNISSPRRNMTPPILDDPSAPAPRPGLGRGLAGRSLGRPVSNPSEPPPPALIPGITAIERAELEELRAEKERLLQTTEKLRSEHAKLTADLREIQNHNAQLIEDHTRDHLSIKAKEAQLIRANSNAEAAEQTIQKQTKEIDRLKRELNRTIRANSPASADVSDQIYRDSSTGVNGTGHHTGMERNTGRESSREVGFQRARGYMASPSEEKENGGLEDGGKKVDSSSPPSYTSREPSTQGREGNGDGIESWRRAAEVTSQLKARIELMKVCHIYYDMGMWI